LAKRSAQRKRRQATIETDVPTTSAARTSKTDLTRQYASAGTRGVFASEAALSAFEDRVVLAHGIDVYDHMAQYEPAMASAERRIVTGATQDRLAFRPPVGKDDARFDLANEIAAFCERAWTNCDEGGHEALEPWLRAALRSGDSACEQTLKVGVGTDAGRYTLESFVVLDREVTAYRLTPEGRLVGLVRSRLSAGDGLAGALAGVEADTVDRRKFTILTPLGNGSRPTGPSFYQPCGTAWGVKRQIIPERVRWVRKRAVPPIVIELAQGAEDEYPIGPDGQPDTTQAPISAVEAAARRGAELENCGVLAVPNGSTVDTLDVTGDDDSFNQPSDWCDRQMHLATLGGVLSSLEAKNGTRAQANVHENASDLITAWLKRKMEAALRKGAFRLLVAVNWGEENADLTPIVSLGDTERKDWSALATAVGPFVKILADLGFEEAIAEILQSMNLPVMRVAPEPAAADPAATPLPGAAPQMEVPTFA
jgi:hypothetical protein